MPEAGKPDAREVAACLGSCCPKRGRCVHYADVESPDEHRVVLTCRTPEGAFPLFRDRRAPVAVAVVDGEGDSCD
jgi:uncharacterized OB-fold protein